MDSSAVTRSGDRRANGVVDGDQVACELIEHRVVDGVTRVDQIAGFYRVQSGRITAKIYREGSAAV
jgi:hypothetical protein